MFGGVLAGQHASNTHGQRATSNEQINSNTLDMAGDSFVSFIFIVCVCGVYGRRLNIVTLARVTPFVNWMVRLVMAFVLVVSLLATVRIVLVCVPHVRHTARVMVLVLSMVLVCVIVRVVGLVLCVSIVVIPPVIVWVHRTITACVHVTH